MPGPSVKPSQFSGESYSLYSMTMRIAVSVSHDMQCFTSIYSSRLDYKLLECRDHFLFVLIFFQQPAESCI